MMFSLLLILSFMMPAPFDLIRDYTVTYNSVTEQVDVTWTLAQPADAIWVFRGDQPMASLPGNATSWTTAEAEFGAYQYSIAWVQWGIMFQWCTDVLYIGKLTWTKSETPEVEGYRIYAAEDPAAFEAPIEEYLDVPGYETEMIPLLALIDAGMVTPGVHTWLAATAYLTLPSEEVLVSGYSVPIEALFTYNIVLCSIALPQEPSGLELSK